MHRFDALSIDPALAASLSTLVLRAFDALALPFLDEASFHLRHHAKHGQNDVAHFSPR